jgi:plasmid stabilization system protein ParE
MKVVYHPAVQTDVSAILRYYEAISPRLSDEFWAELQAAIERAADNPGRFHFQTRDLRRVNLDRFPHHFLFRQLPGCLRVTVVRHNKQHPNTGLSRR